MNRETPILQEVRAVLIATGAVTLWRNNSGADLVAAKHGSAPRFIRYGLGVGSADLVGLLRPTGRFVAFEIKSATGRQSEEQRIWSQCVRDAGGFYALVRSAGDAVAALHRAIAGAAE